MIADTAAVGVIAQGRQRIQEAGRQSSQAAVAQSRIRLLVLDRVDVEAQLVEGLLHVLIDAQIQQVVAQGAPDQELHGQIVDDLRLLGLIGLAGVHPLVDHHFLDDRADRLEQLLLGRVLNASAVAVLEGGLHLLLEPVLIKTESFLVAFHIVVPPLLLFDAQRDLLPVDLPVLHVAVGRIECERVRHDVAADRLPVLLQDLLQLRVA